MSTHPTLAELNEEEALLYRGMLRKLAEMAMNMAATIHDEATSLVESKTPKPDQTIPFERASRTIRRCILLARKLAEPLPQPRPNPNPAPNRTDARKQIIRGVEDAIQRRHRHNEPEIAALESELLDHLDRPDLDHDIATRPIDHIIAEIARDLKSGFLPTDRKFGWKRRTPEDIQTLETRASQPARSNANRNERTETQPTRANGPPHPNGP